MNAVTEVIEIPQSAVATTQGPAADSPIGMMMAAMSQGVSLEQVEKMMDLQNQWERREAEKAFNESLAAFKSEAIEIIKNKKVSFNTGKGTTSYKHAELSDVVEAVGPPLSMHGFAWNWKTEQVSGIIRVTCILKHKKGHSDSVTLEAGADSSGAKNTIQAIASTLTYLQRHTLKAITGVAEKGDDTDGVAPVDMSIIDDWVAAAEGTGSLEELDQIWRDGLGEIQKTNSLDAYSRFRKAVGDSRKRLGAK